MVAEENKNWKEQEALFKKFQNTRDEKLRNDLVEKNLYMVDILVRKYLGKGIEADDLYQVGSLALVKAVDRFDPSKGYTFASFATPTILGEIKKHFRDKGWAIKVPRRLKEIAASVSKARDSLTNELGRMPNTSEIAEYIGVTEKDVLMGMEASMAYSTFSINQTYDEDGEESGGLVYEKYLKEERDPIKDMEKRELISLVIKGLSETNKYIFKKRFIEGKSQAEIARTLEISQMSVSRAEKIIRKEFEKQMAI